MTQKQIITRLIEKAGSVNELSKKTSTAVTCINEWKRELHSVGLIKLLSMCEKLGVELKELLLKNGTWTKTYTKEEAEKMLNAKIV